MYFTSTTAILAGLLASLAAAGPVPASADGAALASRQFGQCHVPVVSFKRDLGLFALEGRGESDAVTPHADLAVVARGACDLWQVRCMPPEDDVVTRDATAAACRRAADQLADEKRDADEAAEEFNTLAAEGFGQCNPGKKARSMC